MVCLFKGGPWDGRLKFVDDNVLQFTVPIPIKRSGRDDHLMQFEENTVIEVVYNRSSRSDEVFRLFQKVGA